MSLLLSIIAENQNGKSEERACVYWGINITISEVAQQLCSTTTQTQIVRKYANDS